VSIPGAGKLTGAVARLPVVEHVDAVGRLEIVGDADFLEPQSAAAEHAPGAGAFVATVGDADAGSGAIGVGLLAHRQLEPGRLAVKLEAGCHGQRVPEVSQNRDRLLWSVMDEYREKAPFYKGSVERQRAPWSSCLPNWGNNQLPMRAPMIPMQMSATRP